MVMVSNLFLCCKLNQETRHTRATCAARRESHRLQLMSLLVQSPITPMQPTNAENDPGSATVNGTDASTPPNKEMTKKSSGRAPVLTIESNATKVNARTVETSGFKVEAKREIFVPRFDGAPTMKAIANKSVTMVMDTIGEVRGLRLRQNPRILTQFKNDRPA